MPEDRKYVRVYYNDLIRDYPDVWADDAALATWLRMLATADPMWPTPPELPRSVKTRPLDRLVAASLVETMPTQRFRMKGMDAERTKRHDAARNAAAQRWQTEGNADGTAKVMPTKAEQSRDEPSKDEQGAPRTPRQVVHRWLTDHGASTPVGWVNKALDEMVRVYGPSPITTLWESAPGDVRTSKQFVQYAERSLSPAIHANGKSSDGGHTRTAKEVDDAFSR